MCFRFHRYSTPDVVSTYPALNPAPDSNAHGSSKEPVESGASSAS